MKPKSDTTKRPAQVCKYCGKGYDPKEVSRIFGSLSPVLSDGYCSSACYTKVMIKEPNPNDSKEGLHTQPYYKGAGEHSVRELEKMCSQFKEYVTYVNSGNKRKALLDENIELKKQMEESLLLYNNQTNTIQKLSDERKALLDALNDMIGLIKPYEDNLTVLGHGVLRNAKSLINNANKHLRQ